MTESRAEVAGGGDDTGGSLVLGLAQRRAGSGSIARRLRYRSPVKLRRSLLVLGSVLLLAATVLVFRAFDAGSHSASDTLRPLLITMAPLWAVSIAAAHVLRSDRR